jgi:hypothetical protein
VHQGRACALQGARFAALLAELGQPASDPHGGGARLAATCWARQEARKRRARAAQTSETEERAAQIASAAARATTTS